VTPVKQLKSFKRLHLKAGEQGNVEFTLGSKDLMLLNNEMKWVVEPGTFTVMIGASSENIKLSGTFSIK
jgi:beta-glucosidase